MSHDRSEKSGGFKRACESVTGTLKKSPDVRPGEKVLRMHGYFHISVVKSQMFTESPRKDFQGPGFTKFLVQRVPCYVAGFKKKKKCRNVFQTGNDSQEYGH